MRKMFAAGAAAALLAVGAGPAAAAEVAQFDFAFTTDRPATASGLGLHVVYRDPDDPDGKAPALEKAAFTLPAGTRIDTTAVPRCEATDEEFRAQGRDACPAASKIGQGFLDATAGAPGDPVRTDVTVFNGPEQVIELVTFAGTNQTAGLDRLSVKGSTLTANPPFTPGGPPDGKTTIREVRIALPARGGLLTTPPSCPQDGIWRGSGTFTFSGRPQATATATVACAAPRASSTPAPAGDAVAPPPASPGTVPAAWRRVRVLTKRVRAGRVARIRVLVEGRCAAGATVRIGREHARTDARGRATVRVRLRRSALVRVSRRGCGRVRGRLRVRR